MYTYELICHAYKRTCSQLRNRPVQRRKSPSPSPSSSSCAADSTISCATHSRRQTASSSHSWMPVRFSQYRWGSLVILCRICMHIHIITQPKSGLTIAQPPQRLQQRALPRGQPHPIDGNAAAVRGITLTTTLASLLLHATLRAVQGGLLPMLHCVVSLYLAPGGRLEHLCRCM